MVGVSHAARRYVVVGASSGLGFQAAKELAKHNAHVVLTARDDERGNECANSLLSVMAPCSTQLVGCCLSS